MKYWILAALTLLFPFFIFAQPAKQTTEFTHAQRTEIESMIHAYLIKNPEILVEASQALRQLRLDRVQENSKKAIQEYATQLFHDPLSPTTGNPKGDVTLVEFIDYQCSHCKEMQPLIEKIRSSDPGLKIIYKQLPIFGENSDFAAKAALASQRQGKFLQFHQALMTMSEPLSESAVLKVAQNVGLNIAKLKDDMVDKVYFFEIKDNFTTASVLGIIGTPAFIIASHLNGDTKDIHSYLIPGATSQEFLQNTIAEMRKK